MPTVLIIDDERLLRWSLRMQLAAVGFRVLEAGSAAEAMQHLEDCVNGGNGCCPDVVFLDYRLPDANGSFPLLDAMLACAPSLPVIMMSAYGTPQVIAEAQARGVRHFLGKPFDMHEAAQLAHQIIS